MTPTTTEAEVHIAGPVEVEKDGGRKRRVIRCLVCDELLWAGAGTPPWTLGAYVAESYGTTERLYTRRNRRRLEPGDTMCSPMPVALL